MAKKKTTKRNGDDAKALATRPEEETMPEFIAQEEETGTEVMEEYRVVPRLKIVQDSSQRVLKERFDVGTCIVASTQEVLSLPSDDNDEEGEPFEVIPLFFFPEWMTCNDIKNQAAGMIRYRTTDKKDPIVQKARNPELREEKDPDNPQFKIMHTEVLNFVCIVDMPGHPMHEQIVLIGFARAEHITGRNLCGLLTSRKAPVYGQRIRFTPRLRPPRNGGDWWGLDFQSAGWVQDAEQFAYLKEQHLELKDLHERSKLVPSEDLDETDLEATPATEDGLSGGDEEETEM